MRKKIDQYIKLVTSAKSTGYKLDQNDTKYIVHAKKVKYILVMEALHILSNSCIQPILDYCHTVWDLCGSMGAHLAHNFQNMAAIFILGHFNDIKTREKVLTKALGWRNFPSGQKTLS